MTGFDITNFTKPVAAEFLPEGVAEGSGLQMKLNLNLISIDLMEKLEAELTATVLKAKNAGEIDEKVINADESAEAGAQISFFFEQKEEIRFKARILGGAAGQKNDPDRLIQEWNMIRKNKAVPVTQEEIIKLGKPAVDALFQFCMVEAGQPTKKSERQ